jgi:hypothetical protein
MQASGHSASGPFVPSAIFPDTRCIRSLAQHCRRSGRFRCRESNEGLQAIVRCCPGSHLTSFCRCANCLHTGTFCAYWCGFVHTGALLCIRMHIGAFLCILVHFCACWCVFVRFCAYWRIFVRTGWRVFVLTGAFLCVLVNTRAFLCPFVRTFEYWCFLVPFCAYWCLFVRTYA